MKVKIYDLVKEILVNDSSCRDSDKKLRWEVWGRLQLIRGSYVLPDHPIFITKENYMKAPNDETIRRCRQKIQEQYPSLRGSEKVRKLRKEIRDQKGTHIFREKYDQGKII